MAKFALHGLSLDNQSSNLDKVFVTLHAFSMSENKKNTVWNSEDLCILKRCVLELVADMLMNYVLPAYLQTINMKIVGYQRALLTFPLLRCRHQLFEQDCQCLTLSQTRSFSKSTLLHHSQHWYTCKKMNFKIFNRSQPILKKRLWKEDVCLLIICPQSHQGRGQLGTTIRR